MNASQERFPVALFIMLFYVVLNFEHIDKILKCYHSDVRATVYDAKLGGSNF